MKILFISSGNNSLGIGTIVKNQGNSLINSGLDVQYFTIRKKGLQGYLAAVFELRSFLLKNKFDIVHAHYSFSGFVAALAGAKPLLVSLMGSDTYKSGFKRLLIKIFYLLFWDAIIVKSEKMGSILGLKKLIVIPNGVDMELFKPINQETARKEINLETKEKVIFFIADPGRTEKNFKLSIDAVSLLKSNSIRLIPAFNIPNETIPLYLNAADVIILSSFWEGSPNIIKEAMACDCPIVTTDVGDVSWVIGNTEGCYICSFATEDVADKVKKAIDFDKKTNGRQRILELGLDSVSIARKVIQVYNTVLFKN